MRISMNDEDVLITNSSTFSNHLVISERPLVVWAQLIMLLMSTKLHQRLPYLCGSVVTGIGIEPTGTSIAGEITDRTKTFASNRIPCLRSDGENSDNFCLL